MSGKPFALAVVAAVLAGTPAVRAEVSSAGPAGFAVKSSVVVAGAPSDVYARFVEIGRWWNPQHSYSGKGENMTLRAQAGGCFCETLPGGGSVEHMRVVFVVPGHTLRMQGGLGPLQSLAATGSMTITFEAAEQQTRVTLGYLVTGYLPGTGLGELATPVDGVLSEQLQRFKKYAETSKS